MPDDLIPPRSPDDAFLGGDEPVPIDDDEEFLTYRVLFIFWISLVNIRDDIADALDDDAIETSHIYEDLQPAVQQQSDDWWHQMHRSAARLAEAARTGDRWQLVPRTVGEEALMAISCLPDYIEWAMELINDERRVEYDSLPIVAGEHDRWDEYAAEITGDADIELIWSPEFEATANPDSVTNRVLGIGDYRPEAWHRLFLRRESQLNLPGDI